MRTDTHEQLNTPELVEIVKRIPAYSKLVYAIYRDASVPNKQKLLVAAALGYMLSPIDIAPGFIPVVGQLDDIIVMLTLLRKAVRSLPPELVEKLREATGVGLALIEADLAAAKKAAWIIARKAGRGLAHATRLVIKAGTATGKAIFRRSPPPPDWPPPDYGV